MIRRKLFPIVSILLSLLVVNSEGVCAAERGPSTPEERAKALEFVELLETTPGSPEAKEATAWLVRWLAEIPDLTVTLCLAPLGTSEELKNVPAELQVQQAFSQAAFLIRNPEAKSGSLETYVAGVEGSLRAYDAMRAAGTVQELKAFEEIKRERASGTLEKRIKKSIRKCE